MEMNEMDFLKMSSSFKLTCLLLVLPLLDILILWEVAIQCIKIILYRLRQQKWPITFMAIFDAFRLILALLHIFYLILIGLRILKWGETSL